MDVLCPLDAMNDSAAPGIPLCVDLDGTLIVGDSLRQAVFHLVVRRPWALLPPAWALLTGGRTAFKESLGTGYLPEPARMLWRHTVLAYLSEQAGLGRRLVLATAAPRRFAEAVARHLDLFESVISSDARNNIKGTWKVEAIRRHLGEGPFDYAGDSWTDLPVFAAARQGIVVSRDARLIERARTLTRIEKVFPE